MDLLKKFTDFVEKYDSVVISYFFNIVFAILIFMLGRFIAHFTSNQLRRILTEKEVDPTVIKFVSSFSKYALFGLTFVAALGQLGVQTSSIVAIIGAAGLTIGLALQGSLSNFASGVLLIIFRPFRVGELVVIGNIQGNIDSIQIFSTTILTPTGELVTIPNNQVLSTNIINYSRQPNRRIDLTISVEYQADIQTVYSALRKATEKTENVLTTPEPIFRLCEFAASSVNFLVLAWVKNADYGATRPLLLENIKKELDKNNISIPYPVLDVNVKK